MTDIELRPHAVFRIVSATARLSRIAARVAGGIIALCALLIACEVVLRNLFGVAVLNSFELGTYGFAAALALGFAHAMVERAHIRIDILYTRLPLMARALVDVLTVAGLTVMATVMAWHAWTVVATSYRLGAVSNSTLQLPLVIPQSLWAIGLSWFVCVGCVLTLQTLVLLATGQLARLHEEHGVARLRADPEARP